jgi:ABC-type transport system substrate-binding protein
MYAIDNAAIAKFIGFGLYQPANQFAAPGGYGYNPDVVGYPYNLQKAKKLLAEAGYPNGFATKITYRTGSSDYESAFTAIQGYLGELGIKVTLEAVDRGRAAEISSSGWKDQLVWHTVPCSVGFDTGKALSMFFSSKMARYDSKSVYFPDEYNSMLEMAKKERDPQKREALFRDLMKLITDDYCLAFPIYVLSRPTVHSNIVHDLDLSSFSPHDWNPEKAWISK